MEFSNSTPGLALRGLQCGMVVKVRDNTSQVWMNVALRANFERSVENLNLNQFSKFKVYKRKCTFLSLVMYLNSF